MQMSSTKNIDNSQLTVDSGARQMVTDPAEFFGHSYYAMHHLPPNQLDELQLAALKWRFAELRNRIPVLTTLADELKIDGIERTEDVVPLLFQHSVYKSYPSSLLEKNRFSQLTRWLSRLTTCDLSKASVENCDSIDSWLDVLDSQTDLRPLHSSGTAGSMSFFPRSVQESDPMTKVHRVGLFMFSDPKNEKNHDGEYFHVVWPTYRRGRGSLTRFSDFFMKYMAGSESNFHPLYQERLSADAMYLAARIRAATARGEADKLVITPAMQARREEFERAQHSIKEAMPRFFERIVDELKGQRVWFFGISMMIYEMSRDGLARGLSSVFAPDSVVASGGGAKGQVLPDGWEDVVKRFSGVDSLQQVYGMTELCAVHRACKHDRYHIEPFCILFLLNPDDGTILPRKGIQTGRAAFFDLMARTYWGGIITGDEITVDWNTCACGQTTPHVSKKIERFSAKTGGDKITCAATDAAHENALEFLNDKLV